MRCRRSIARWQGIEGPTVVHLCFGYAAVVADKPSGYSFLPELADTTATQISIEAAQPRLDLGVLRNINGKTIMLGVLDLGEPTARKGGRYRCATDSGRRSAFVAGGATGRRHRIAA